MRTLPFILCFAVAAPVSARLTDKDKATIKALVTTSQEAGLTKGNVDAYLAAFAKDARWVLGRGEKPLKTDTTIGYEAGAGRARLRARSKQDVDVSFSDVTVTGAPDDAAVVSLTATITAGDYEEVLRERYVVRRTPGPPGWKIVENRSWPLSTKAGGEVRRYDEATWRRLDAAVEAAKDPKARAQALLEAWRPRDAYAMAKEATQEHPKDAEAWLMRAVAAYGVGAEKDALAAATRARELDPDGWSPPWAR